MLPQGTSDARGGQDHGFMYSRSFYDPDGHHWEVDTGVLFWNGLDRRTRHRSLGGLSSGCDMAERTHPAVPYSLAGGPGAEVIAIDGAKGVICRD